MFKEIKSGFFKFFTNERILILVIFLILAWGMFSYAGSKNSSLDNMTSGFLSKSQDEPSPMEDDYAASYAEVESASQIPTSNGGYTLQPVVNPDELLPKDENSQWAALNPNTMNQGDIMMPDLLQAGYHIGLDTIGQTLRNANYQLRSDPIITKKNIGPWMQSTIEPDLGRVPLEIGQGPR